MLQLRQARGPSAAARTGLGAGSCGHKDNYIHVLRVSPCTKLIGLEVEGVQKLYVRKLSNNIFPIID